MEKALDRFRKIIDTHTDLILFVVVAGYLIGMVVVIGLDRPLWRDEIQFINTIRVFGEEFSLGMLSDYRQPTGPLVFLVYSLWGKIVGFEAANLRILSLIFSGTTLLLIYRLFVLILRNRKAALLAVCLLLINPYMWGLGIFVYTDIPTLCFSVMFVWAVYRRQALFLAVTTALALLARQYSAYLIVAAGVYQLVTIYRGEKTQMKNVAALIVGCLPLIVLMILWGGVAPPSGMKRWVVTESNIYNCGYITTYVLFMAAYLSPVILIMRRQLFQKGSILLLSSLLSCWYLFFPVRPSAAALIQTEYDTVGLLHRLIKSVIPIAILENILLWGFFWCGLVVLANIVHLDIKRLRNGIWDYGHFLTLAVLCFLFMMPFSYQVWEKYLVSVLPFIMLRLMIMKYPKPLAALT